MSRPYDAEALVEEGDHEPPVVEYDSTSDTRALTSHVYVDREALFTPAGVVNVGLCVEIGAAARSLGKLPFTVILNDPEDEDEDELRNQLGNIPIPFVVTTRSALRGRTLTHLFTLMPQPVLEEVWHIRVIHYHEMPLPSSGE